MFGGQKNDTLRDYGEIMEPSEAAEPILAKPVRDALLEWLTEIFAEEELAKVGIPGRRRALFSGPPGVGKTTLAHHLAARIGLVMVAVRPELIIDCWLGSTGRNIGKLFDLASEADPPVVLFMDEFDALAPQRRADAGRGGAQTERNAAVNTLLQRIEQYKGFLIAATNRSDDIDPAIWRRFDLQIGLELPGQSEREHILARYLHPFGMPKDALRALSGACETASPALIRQLCENLKRQIVLGPKVGWDMERGAVFDRLVTSIHPHPENGKPRLWSKGSQDNAVPFVPWPLPEAKDVSETADAMPVDSKVLAFSSARRNTT